jgi:phosphohistidine swiveling domain-containing protein
VERADDDRLVQLWRDELDTRGPADWEFSRGNPREAFPDVVTPLSWSVLEPHVRCGASQAQIRIGMRDSVETRPGGAMAYFGGRVVTNQSQSRELLTRMPNMSSAAHDRAMTGVDTEGDASREADAGPTKEQLEFVEQIARGTAAELATSEERARRTTDSILKSVADGFGAGVAAFDNSAPAFALAWEEHCLATILATGDQATINAVAAQLVPDAAGQEELESLVAAAAENIPTGALGRELARIAQMISAKGIAATLSDRSPADALAALPADIRVELNAFCDTFGHRCPSEMDLASTTWKEDPAQLVPLLAALAKGDPAAAPPPERHHDALQLIGERFGPEVEGELRPHVERAMRTLALREQHKDLVVRVYAAMRTSMKALGADLAARGLLEEPGDVFMLTESELRRLDAGEALKDLAARRRATLPLLDSLEVPSFFTVPMTLEPRVHEGPRPESKMLHGQAVVPGMVRARARVLHDAWDGADLEPGEILVAVTTDAAWTPLFLVAGAVVTEIGAAVSHAAITAREFGVPTIVGVEGLTRSVRTGDLLSVDAARGTIEIV